MLFKDYDSRDDANIMTGIIIILESSIMLCRSLEWSMKWKPGPEQVLQAFGPLLLLHALSESRDTDAGMPWRHSLAFHHPFLKGTKVSPSEYTPKTLTARTFRHSNLRISR